MAVGKPQWSKSHPGMRPRIDGRANNGRKKGTTKNKVQGEIAKPKRKTNSIKIKDSDYQDVNRKEFLRVKVGESVEDWNGRTAKKRVFGIRKDNKILVANNGKLRTYRHDRKGKAKEKMLEIIVRFTERPYDYLKCYAFIMRWASVRYDIFKDDLELGYYFYDGKPFTKEEFNYVCIQLGTVRGVFSRFYKSGYIMPYAIISSSGVIKDTEYYCLTVEFVNLIKRTYDVISKVAPMKLISWNGEPKLDEELIVMLQKLNTEIEETINGIKKPEKIIFRNEE